MGVSVPGGIKIDLLIVISLGSSNDKTVDAYFFASDAKFLTELPAISGKFAPGMHNVNVALAAQTLARATLKKYLMHNGLRFSVGFTGLVL